MMKTLKFETRMDSRGRVILPKSILDALKVKKGAIVQFESKGNRVHVTAGTNRRVSAGAPVRDEPTPSPAQDSRSA